MLDTTTRLFVEIRFAQIFDGLYAKTRRLEFGNGGRFVTPEARHKGQQVAKVAHVLRTREAYADLVPLLRELREAGASMRSIAAHLNEMGHRNQRKHRRSISNVRAIFIREGMEHLTNILGPNRNITPEIQRLGCAAAGAATRRKAKVADAHIVPLALRLYAGGVSLRSIAHTQ